MADIGYISLFLALIVSLYSTAAFIISWRRKQANLFASARNGLLVVCGLVTVAVVVLFFALATHNFEIAYVAEYTSRDLNSAYLIAALWAGGNGSLLFWAWLVSVFGAAMVLQKRDSGQSLLPYAAAVVLFTEVLFLTLLIVVGSPFQKLPFVPPDGSGLNPLLQNPGMLFHPPTLLAGYAGLTIPFAFTIAALLLRRVDEVWLASARRWTLIAWLLLGVGNVLGAWWAYVELGWGGYWAWDPVENSSLMPWLICTAFLHSMIMQKRRGIFKVWSASLIIISFVLPVLGTFLTRSGILDSVHAFQDPVQARIGSFFLGFAAIVVVGSFGLLFSRRDQLVSEAEIESLVSRESAFLLNNLLFGFSTLAIFLGTFFPVISNVISGGQVTIGPEFFNKVNGPIFLGIVLLAGICATIGWRQASAKNLVRNLLWPAVIAVVVAIVLVALGMRQWYAVVAFTICAFVVLTIVYELVRGARSRGRSQKENYAKAFFGLIGANRPRYGGLIVHLSIVLIAFGVVGSSLFTVSKETALIPGDSLTLNQYQLTYERLDRSQTQNKDIATAIISVAASGKLLGQLLPQQYIVNNQKVSEVAIRSTLREDLYVILDNPDENGAAAFKVIVNPLVSWMWIGGVVLVLGGLFAFWPEIKKETAIPMRRDRKGN